MKKALSMLLAAMMLFALVACGGGASSAAPAGSTPAGSTPAGAGSTPAAEGDSIIIGGLAPLTGNVAQYGVAASNGAKLAVEEVNAAGGVLGKQIDFIVYDEKGDATEAVNAYNKLVADGMVALVGDVTTKPTIAVSQVAAQDGIPMITPSATGAVVTEAGPNVFRVCFTDPYQGELMAHYAVDELGATTAAVLYDTGDDYSSGIAETFQSVAGDIGLEVVSYDGYATGAADFSAQLTKIKESNPDVILAPCYYEDAAKIIVQARALGITSKFLGPDGWDGVLNQLDASNYDALADSYYCSQYSAENPSAELQKFMDDYSAAYGEDMNMFAVLGYEAMRVMCAAIEKAGSTDSAAIVAAMADMEYPGLTGTISYPGDSRDPSRDAYIIEFENGEEKVLGTYNF